MRHNTLSLLTLSLVFCGLLSGSPAQAYEAGTFSIKPININLTGFSIGNKPTDSDFTITSQAPSLTALPLITITKRVKLNAWKAPLSFGYSESDRNGTGYGFEAGYVVIKNWEVFGRAGYCHENPKVQFLVGNEHSFKFKSRNNWGLTLGLRRYLETSNAFKPYLAAALGFVSQGATKTDVYSHALFDAHFLSRDTLQTQMRLLKKQMLFSFELSAGADYIFNEHWAVSGSVAIRYNQRGGSSNVLLPADPALAIPVRPMTYRDNKQVWYIPVTVSLKCMF